MEVTSHNAWERQQKEIERIRLENPSLLERDSLPDPDLLLSQVGITGLDQDRPRGYLRYLPQDFIVEEIRPDGSICSIEPTRSIPDDHTGDRRTLYCNLIKVNLPTTMTLKYLQEYLNLKPEQIGFAGSKDAVAITSQRVSFRDVDWKDISQKKIPQIKLEPISYGNGAIQRGDLRGNRFTILVRDDGKGSSDRLRSLVETYNKSGFLNFFGLQRFGSRKISHKFGCLLARGDIDGCLRSFFTEKGIDDLPLFKKIRDRLAVVYGNWKAMKEIVEPFPHTFVLELKVLDSLIAEPKKTINALMSIKGEARKWIESYNHWVVNRYLSEAHRSGGVLPKQLPLPLVQKDIYHDKLKMDGVHEPDEHVSRFGFSSAQNQVSSLVQPVVNRVMKVDEGTIFSVSLPHYSDPHSYLSHMYKLHAGLPAPGWVRGGEMNLSRFVV